MLGILLACWLGVSVGNGPVPSCELVEINHVMYPDGSPRFTQVICWESTTVAGRWRVRDYRAVHCYERHSGVLYLSTDPEFSRPECLAVRGKLYRETWTTHDPERDDILGWPVDRRRLVWPGGGLVSILEPPVMPPLTPHRPRLRWLTVGHADL